MALDLHCVDRLLLNAYAPTLQCSGQVVAFMRYHLGKPAASPAVMNQIGNRFRREVKAFAEANRIPILRLKKPDRSRWDDRKLDHVWPHLDRPESEGRFGVVAIVSAQEFAFVYSAKDRSNVPGHPWFEFVRERRRVGIYYFCINNNAHSGDSSHPFRSWAQGVSATAPDQGVSRGTSRPVEPVAVGSRGGSRRWRTQL